MAVDYDLSNLQAEQADAWLYLQLETILGQIVADQTKRLGFPFNLLHSSVSAVTGKSPAISTNG